jgi:hypothetical protein
MLAAQVAAPPAPPAIAVSVDTSLAQAAQWPLRISTSGTTRVTVLLAPVAPDAPPFYREARLVRATETFLPLQGVAGTPLESGIYRLQVVSEDSASGVEISRVRVLAVERAKVDTQAYPPALDRGSFLPETTWVKTRRPGYLLIAGIGVASLATSWSMQDESISPITIAVPATLAIGGLVGFVRGKTVAQPMTANTRHNRDLVTADVASRQAVASANARARADASVRIRVVDQP